MGVITELARRAPTMMIPSATSPLLFFYEMSFARGVNFCMLKYLTRNPWQSVGREGGVSRASIAWSAPFGKTPP